MGSEGAGSTPSARSPGVIAYGSRSLRIEYRSVEELVALFAQAMDKVTGTEAVMIAERLAALGGPDAVEVCVAALTPPRPRWSSHAAFLLGELRAEAESAVPALIACLPDPASGGHHQVAHEAIRALAKIGTPDATAALLDLAAAWRTTARAVGERRCSACLNDLVWGLSRLGDAPCLDALLDMTRVAQTPWDGNTAWVIAKVADERFVPLLVELCAGPGLEAGLAGLERVATARAVPALVRVLHSREARRLRYRAARGLAKAGPFGVFACGTHAYRNNRDADALSRRLTAWVLGNGDGPQWTVTRSLKELAEDEDAYVRGQAVTSLGLVGDDSAGELLIRALEDPAHRVRARAATALARVAPALAEERLEQAAGHDPVRCVRDAAAAALRGGRRQRHRTDPPGSAT